MAFKKIFCRLLLLIGTAYAPSIIAMSAAAADDQHEVVVDLMGFMVEVNNKAAVGQLGIRNLLGSMLGGSNPQTLQPEFFKLLAQIDERETPSAVFWQDHEAPYPIYEHLVGNRTSAALLADVLAGIERLNPSNKALMKSCAEMTFDPAKNTKIMQAIPGACALMHELHQARRPLYVLANWSAEGAQHLFDSYVLTTEQTYLSGEVMTSGKTGTVKSGDLLAEFQRTVKPRKPIFVETDSRHIGRLEQLQAEGRLDADAVAILHTGDFAATRRKLIEHGVLKED